MTLQCTFTKPNGQQCRAKALWGSDPPRCAAHRQDGGPRPPLFRRGNQYARLGISHGYYRRPFSAAQSMEEEAAELLVKHEQLAGLIATQPDRGQLLNLYRFYSLNLAHLLQLLQRYEESTGQNPDRLLQQANGQPKAEIRARLKRLRQDLEREAGSSYPGTTQRSPRYWLVYEFIVSYIERYWVGPTRAEIKQGCRISSNRNVAYWLEKLEADGLIIRRRGLRRGLDLPDRMKSS